ncbi:MAG: hypothetical protein Q9214_003333 [Letrouitia sp. 1 TL-2023]
MFGPASGGFISKWLIDEIKVTELQLEDDKKGLTDENKTRFYSYIKPLYAAIGPKSTKCLSTENLDFLDLEKAVSVTITTQTPEVPSGNVFSVKTRYCLITGLSKPKKGKKKKGDIDVPENQSANVIVEVSRPQKSDWGLFEPLHGFVSPIADIISPLINSNTIIIFLLFLLLISWFKGPKARRAGGGGDVGLSLMSTPERMAAYDEMWRVEENELWNWLDERMGMHETSYLSPKSKMPVSETRAPRSQQKHKSARAKRVEDAMNEREVDYAIRVTEERLEQLKAAVRRRRQKPDEKDGVEKERVPAEEL